MSSVSTGEGGVIRAGSCRGELAVPLKTTNSLSFHFIDDWKVAIQLSKRGRSLRGSSSIELCFFFREFVGMWCVMNYTVGYEEMSGRRYAIVLLKVLFM
jgi:hypothetical protein